jgi:hypothetical protein
MKKPSIADTLNKTPLQYYSEIQKARRVEKQQRVLLADELAFKKAGVKIW